MKQQQSAGLILFRKKNEQREYLLLHYPHGHWDLPKGKLEAGETKKEAALRELQEETGLSASFIDGFEESLEYIFQHDHELIKKTVTFFIGTAIGDSITLSHEHIGCEWLPFEKAIERLTFENAQKVLRKAESFLHKEL